LLIFLLIVNECSANHNDPFGFSFAATSSMRQQVVYHAVGGGNIGNLNVAVIWVAGILVLLQLLVFETPLGNRVLAVGGDPASSYSRGVNVTKIKFGVFVSSGLLAAFAGILEAAYIGYADGSFGVSMELSAIAAAVLGGCHLGGGRISLIGTLLGASCFVVSRVFSSFWVFSLNGISSCLDSSWCSQA
jgi:ribose/xylose/arabinose/galactoside ABC-type transport system permease subunit